jgi:hypothetical protein
MACLISKDGNMAVCGVSRRKNYYFDKGYRGVWSQPSLWYEPALAKNLKRKKFARIDLFIKKARKKLGFRPLSQERWWKTVALPEIKATMKYERQWRKKK